MTSTEELEPLVEAIDGGRPLVLLLGQDSWSGRDRPDPVLTAAQARLGRSTSGADPKGFTSLLASAPIAEDFYDWLADQYDLRAAPEWLEPVTAIPWNAIFTTAVDPSLARSFRRFGREVEVVLSKEDSPASPRHRHRLHITYLFGRAGERARDDSPPRSVQELRTRVALHAAPLLARAVETTTALGVLVVDGFSPERDWLSAESLAGLLGAFQPGQVLWFGWEGLCGSASEDLLGDLVGPGGPVIPIRDRLAVGLRSLALAHRIDLSASLRVSAQDSVSVGDGLLQVPPATRLKTSTGAAIIDDSWLAPLAPLGPDAEYSKFRRFHGWVEDPRRLVDGLRRGFAIKRGFEAAAAKRVRYELENAGRGREPVLIHGQSGTGKSLGLSRLAFELRNERQYPVLLALRASRVPGVDELDDFCLQAEDMGAPATLVVCDANAPAVRYRDLLLGFSSRGRRVVVVGSTYRIVDSDSKAEEGREIDSLIEAPAELSEEELVSLLELLERFVGSAPKVTESHNLLPAIYRMLPDVRPLLAAGLAREARVAEERLRERGRSAATTPQSAMGQLGHALAAAGVVNPQAVLEQRVEEFLGCLSDAASRAVDFVMVPGKLDCAVPINLLMRAVGGERDRADVASLFAGIDLFRWSEDYEGEVYIHPRIRVEAELIISRRLGTAQAEAETVIRLLDHANPGPHGSCERRFVLDLVHRVGPDGPYGLRYSQSYLELARALTEMRTRRGVLDPSLMLQEATLRRRVLRDAPRLEDVDPAEVLEEAREVVDLALDEFGTSASPGLKRMCANLKVERAAIYGFRAVQRLNQDAPPEEIWQFYIAARDSARAAVFTADTYYAVDISLWVPNDLLRKADWDKGRRAELVADIWDALERVDPSSLDPEQREQYEKRRVRIGQALDDNRLEQEALEALEVSGSRAGYYLHARNIGGSLTGRGGPSSEEVGNARRAAAFLEQNREVISDDSRCLRYLLRCKWLGVTGSFLFGMERGALPWKERDLRAMLEMVETVRVVEGSLGDPRLRYLQAVLQWRLRREHDARQIWQELSQETEYSDARRVIRHHLWTGPDGRPQLFHGRVVSDELGRGRFRVRVEEIRQEVELLQRDFRDLSLRRGSSVSGGFLIAFNYIGPLADRPTVRTLR